MDQIAEFAQSLQGAGLQPALIDTGAEPYHIAVPLPGQSVDDEPVLRINLLDSHAGDLELWQMIMVFPEQAVSDGAWALVTAMLNPVNRVFMGGKVIADEDSRMLYATYEHMTATGGSACLSGPPVVRYMLESCAVLAPSLGVALTHDPTDSDKLDAAINELARSEQELEALLVRLLSAL